MASTEYLSTIDDIIEDARNGRMFILVDDEERENEGDLVIPAQMATPDAINFMATNGRGLICLALTQNRINQLNLHPRTKRHLMRLMGQQSFASKPMKQAILGYRNGPQS